jgi:7,8-dihydroneopterin aldolase/epimerase/oxygenase
LTKSVSDTGLTIELLGLELHGFHGVLEQERRAGQRFLVDVWLEPSDATAAETDRIEDAVDYRDVVALVREVSDGHAYRLLEALAGAIAEALVARLRVRQARVRVRKPDVVLELPVEHAAVIAERRAPARESSP